jgi:uncharacterized protein (DUF58 family)
MSPTPRAAALCALIAVLAIALPLDPLIWFPVLALLVGAAAADAFMAGQPPAMKRDVRSSLVRGEPVGLRIELSTQAARQGGAARRGTAGMVGRTRVRQAVPPELTVEPSESPRGLTASLTATVRGRHVLPPVVLRCTGPLGLMRRDFACGDAVELSVFPDLPGARRRAAARQQRSRDEGLARGALGLGTEFEAIREYAPDDDIRRVNWKATERLGRPMTNQYRVEQDREVLFVVDSGRLMGSPVGDGTRLDASLDALASVAVAADDSGDRPGALAFAGDIRRQIASRRRGAEGLVRALEDLDAVDVDSDYELAFRVAAEHKRALVLVLTDLLDDSASRHLADAMPLLARRHAVLIASVRDPDLDAIVSDPPSRLVDVAGQAVALDVLGARERVAARLRGYGAMVIDQPAHLLAEACVGGYIKLKRRARV